MRARLDIKYWFKLTLKDRNMLKEYIRHIKQRGRKEFRKDNTGFRNSKYNIPFKRTPNGFVYDGAGNNFEQRNGKWYIAKEV